MTGETPRQCPDCGRDVFGHHVTKCRCGAMLGPYLPRTRVYKAPENPENPGPPAKDQRARVKEALELLTRERTRSVQWARDLMARDAAGEALNIAQLVCARQALEHQALEHQARRTVREPGCDDE